MKSLSCLICSVNITFVKTKGEYVFNLRYQYNSDHLKIFFCSDPVNCCERPVVNSVKVILTIIFLKTVLVKHMIS